MAALRQWEERHESVEFPDNDDLTVYSHNINTMWFETQKTKDEMANESVKTKRDCGGCRNGSRDEWSHPLHVDLNRCLEKKKTKEDRRMERRMTEMITRRRL